jgi:hypothetical protein
MTTDNWIALLALIVPLFGTLCVAAYQWVKLLIKCSILDAEVKRLAKENERKDAKIFRLQNQIRGMN